MSRGASGELSAGRGARRRGCDRAPSPGPGCVSRRGCAQRADPGAGLAGTPARGRGGVRAVLLCGRARRLVLCGVCTGGALCAVRLWGARQLPRLGVAGEFVRVCVCVVCCVEEREKGGERRERFPDPSIPDAGAGCCDSLPRAPLGSLVCTPVPQFPTWSAGRVVSPFPSIPPWDCVWFGQREMKQGQTWELFIFPTDSGSRTFI